jgi:hypothetical protein
MNAGIFCWQFVNQDKAKLVIGLRDSFRRFIDEG